MVKSQIDFKTYRSPELVAAITDLIDVRNIYVSSLLKILLATLITVILIILFFWNRCSLPVFAATACGGFFAGSIIGFLFAILTVIRNSIGNMIQIVDRLLELTKTVAGDVRAMGAGEMEMPSAAALVKGVYGDVVLPTVETVIRDKLGIAGRPVMFMYRMTLGQLVRLTIRMLPAEAFSRVAENKPAEPAGQEILESMQSVADKEGKIVSSLTNAQQKINSISHGLRFFMMLPGYAFCGAVVLFILFFFVLAWLLTAPEADNGQVESALRNALQRFALLTS